MQTRDIKRRIRSVKNTQQITRAMKFVAAAKLRKAQERMLAMRPYADRLSNILLHLSRDLYGDEHPLFRTSAVVPKRVVTIVVAGDRGLCGGFNGNILRTARAHFDSMPGTEQIVFAIGKRAIAGLRKGSPGVRKGYHDVFEKLSYVLAGDICDQLVAMMGAEDENRIDAAYIVYNEFRSMVAQKPVTRQLLPLDLTALRVEQAERQKNAPADATRPLYEIEPNPEEALARLVSRRLATEVFQGTLESYSAELAARMTAMDNATTNADDMIARLTLLFNRVRQSGITSELMDIVGGANALS